MKILKIVYISRSIIPSKTANSINVVRTCATFASLGHQVTLLAPITKKLEHKDTEDIFEFYGVEKNFEIKKLFSPNIKWFKRRIYEYRCFNQVKKINPDIVYGRDVVLAFYLTQKAGYKTLIELHKYGEEKKFEDILFRKFLLENKNQVKLVTITQKLKEVYCKEYNIETNAVHVLLNATRITKDFDTIPDNCEKFKNSFNVGYIGMVGENRGLDIIIKLAQNFTDMIFHIVGGDDKKIKFWKNKTENLENIIFHGFVEPKNTYKYRNLCDVLLAIYIKDFEYISPMKVFEYMASKTSIICSDAKIIRESIDERYALLADNNDINSWIENLRKLYKDAELRNELSKNTYEYCIENFTYEIRCKKILNLYKKC